MSTPEPIAQEPQEPQAPAVPEWVEERFHNADNPVEAQARSYAEAQREMNRLRADSEKERKEFTEALSALAEREQQAPQYSQQTDPLLSAAQRAYDDGDVTTFLAIQAQISQAATAQILDQRLGQFEERFQQGNSADQALSLRLAEEQVQRVFGEDRWAELAPKVQEGLAGAPLPPTPSVEGYATHLLNLARLADYERLTKQTEALEAERAAKLSAQTLDNGGRVQLTAPKNADAWQEIKNADSGSWSKITGG